MTGWSIDMQSARTISIFANLQVVDFQKRRTVRSKQVQFQRGNSLIQLIDGTKRLQLSGLIEIHKERRDRVEVPPRNELSNEQSSFDLLDKNLAQFSPLDIFKLISRRV